MTAIRDALVELLLGIAELPPRDASWFQASDAARLLGVSGLSISIARSEPAACVTAAPLRVMTAAIVAVVAGVDVERLRPGGLGRHDWAAVASVAGELARLPIWIRGDVNDPVRELVDLDPSVSVLVLDRVLIAPIGTHELAELVCVARARRLRLIVSDA